MGVVGVARPEGGRWVLEGRSLRAPKAKSADVRPHPAPPYPPASSNPSNTAYLFYS